jgi:16S rRNA (cytidine1402-2'-O)-methyltransferase
MNFEKSILYLVPTPIGNLKDMTYRAVETLNKVDLIAAEDTRTSFNLLKHYEIKTSMVSYHKYNERKRAASLIEKLKAGKSIAIISDAGTPGISDPSNVIVKEAIENGIKVVALPGATAFVPALTASGFDTDHFYFHGFLSDKENESKLQLESISKVSVPTIYYVSPHKLQKTIIKMQKIMGDRKFVAAREISKLHETFFRGKFSDYINNPDLIKLKGEFVVLVDGKKEEEISEEQIVLKIKTLLEMGYSKSKAVKVLSKEQNLPKNKLYDLALDL